MGKQAVLVLGGGGAKGAFQVAAEKYARVKQGYQWTAIAGVSVGALNGTFIALKKYDELQQLWNTISNDKVYTGSLNSLRILWRFLLQKKSIFDRNQLAQQLTHHITDEAINNLDTDLRIGAVSLRDGKYYRFLPKHMTANDFQNALMASSAIPVFFPPVNINKVMQSMVDGGIRNMAPLGDILDTEPKEVVIIDCNPINNDLLKQPPTNMIDIGYRSLVDIAINEIFITDLREFLRINFLVKQAAQGGIKLYNENGKELKYYKYKIIQPQKELKDTIDFSKHAIKYNVKQGFKEAKRILG